MVEGYWYARTVGGRSDMKVKLACVAFT